MQQVKFFKGVVNSLGDLEHDMNSWLEETDSSIVQIFGNIAPQTQNPGSTIGHKFESSDILIAVVYEKE